MNSKMIKKSLKLLQIFIIILTFTQTSLGNAAQNSKLSNLKNRYFTFGIHYKEKSLFDDNSHNYFSIGYNFCNKHAFRLNFNYRLIYKETNDVEYFQPDEALGNGDPWFLQERYQIYLNFDYAYKANITDHYFTSISLGPFLRYQGKAKNTGIIAEDLLGGHTKTMNSIYYEDHTRVWGFKFSLTGYLILRKNLWLSVGLDYSISGNHINHRNIWPIKNSRYFNSFINDWDGINIGLSYRL